MRCVSPKMDGSNGQTAQLMGLPEDLGYRHPLAETQNLKVVKLVILGYTYMILDTIWVIWYMWGMSAYMYTSFLTQLWMWTFTTTNVGKCREMWATNAGVQRGLSSTWGFHISPTVLQSWDNPVAKWAKWSIEEMSKYHQNSQPLQKSNLSAFITFSVGCYPQNPIIKIFHWILLSLCCLIIILILPPWILPIGYCKNQSLHY